MCVRAPRVRAADGRLIAYDGSMGEVVYPVFVNEAAYYLRESGRGVGVARRVDWPVPAADECGSSSNESGGLK